MATALQYVAPAVPDYGGWEWDAGFAEISRPCLRHAELEVELVVVDESLPAESEGLSEDDWFAGGSSEHALQTIALNTDDAYLPEPRSLRGPVLIGAGVVALAAAAASAVFLL